MDALELWLDTTLKVIGERNKYKKKKNVVWTERGVSPRQYLRRIRIPLLYLRAHVFVCNK